MKMKQETMKKECTFKPQLSKLTRKIMSKKRQGSLSSKRSNSGSRKNEEVFNKLYEDSKEHKKRLKYMARKLLKNTKSSFHSKVNPFSSSNLLFHLDFLKGEYSKND